LQEKTVWLYRIFWARIKQSIKRKYIKD